MGKPDIAIIINSFDRCSLLKECLGALSKWVPNSEFKDRCVIVVYDAGSSDGSVQWLNDYASESGMQLHVVQPKQGDNTSFAAGLNSGVAYAKEKYPALKYLMFYETDNQILQSEALIQALDALLATDKLAACGFTVRRHNGSAAGVGQPFPSLLNFSLGNNLVQRFQLEAIPYRWKMINKCVAFSEVDVVYTSPLLVRYDAWAETGGLDAGIFPFSDCDVDWARRLHERGWKMGVVKTDDVIHDNREAVSCWSRTRAMHFHRGRLRYFRRHHPVAIFLIWPLVLMMRHLLELISVVLFIKEKSRRQQLVKQFLSLFLFSLKGYE